MRARECVFGKEDAQKVCECVIIIIIIINYFYYIYILFGKEDAHKVCECDAEERKKKKKSEGIERLCFRWEEMFFS